MPRLRRLGYGLETAGSQLLNFALGQMAQRREQEQRAADARALAELQSKQRMAEEQARTDNDVYQAGLANPTIGRQLARSGVKRPGLDPSDNRLMLPTLDAIGKADQLAKLPTHEEIDQQAMAAGVELPFGFGNLNLPAPAVAGASAARNAREKMLQGEERKVTTGVEETLPDGSKRKSFIPTVDLPGRSFTTGLSAALEGANAGAKELATLTAPGLTEAKVTEANQLEAGTRGEKVKTAGAEAGARAAAQFAVDWSPKAVATKLDFEKQKAIAELGRVGMKLEAEEVAKKSAAVKGLLPVYQQYRTLVRDVVQSPLGAASESTASLLNAISHTPVVGGFAASSLEGLHAAVGSLADSLGLDRLDPRVQGIGQKIAELNRVTDTLALGMTNAVLGNKGQTTENDVRTAKNILVNSFTGVKTAEELIGLTDRMFTILPNMAVAHAGLPPAEVIKLAAEEAKKQTGAQFQPIFGSPAASPAEQKFNQLFPK